MSEAAGDGEFQRIEDVVTAMRAKFAQRRAEAPEADLAQIEDRFVRFDLFPAFGWPLLRAGVHEAVQSGDAQRLHEALVKFTGLSYRSENRFDDAGLTLAGGVDYCTFVPLAVHAAALGDAALVRRLFHAQRPLSRHGHAALRNAANLLVLAGNPGWQHGEKAVALAQKAVAGKSTARVDRAFIDFFLAVRADDAPRRRAALAEFAGLYLRSDWGRHKPFTQPLFAYGLAGLARWFCPSFDWHAEAAPLFDATWTALWADYELRRAAFDVEAGAFSGELAFLRCEEA